MNILDAVLKELDYEEKETFKFELTEDKVFTVFPFVSKTYTSQVFLVIEVQYSDIGMVRNSQFLSNLADAFCQQDIHSGAMDRNTSLIITSLKSETAELDEEQIMEEIVKIEDDPYYFKKYVFSYTADEEKGAEEFFSKLAEEGEFSYISQIQNYLAEATNFMQYKSKPQADLLYKYFVELVTKVSTFPLKVVCSGELINIENLLDEKAQSAFGDSEREGVDELLKQQIDFKDGDLDEILKICNECFKIN